MMCSLAQATPFIHGTEYNCSHVENKCTLSSSWKVLQPCHHLNKNHQGSECNKTSTHHIEIYPGTWGIIVYGLSEIIGIIIQKSQMG